MQNLKEMGIGDLISLLSRTTHEVTSNIHSRLLENNRQREELVTACRKKDQQIKELKDKVFQLGGSPLSQSNTASEDKAESIYQTLSTETFYDFFWIELQRHLQETPESCTKQQILEKITTLFNL